MCGRFISTTPSDKLGQHFNVDVVDSDRPEPDYNVAPRQGVHVVADELADQLERHLQQMKWGLTPSWAKDPKVGDKMINARAESVAEKPAYRSSFKKHRCIIPADGFYEWKVVEGEKKKQPMFIAARSRLPLAFAGLFAHWRDPNDPAAEWLSSCAIITTTPNAAMAPIHNRMPVILEPEDWDRWLDPTNQEIEELKALLVPASDELLETYEITMMVNNPRNHGPELITPKADFKAALASGN